MTEDVVPTTAADIEREARTLRATLTAYASLADPLTVMEGKHILQMVADLAHLVAGIERTPEVRSWNAIEQPPFVLPS